MMNNAKNTTYVVGILPRVSIVRPNHVVGWLQGKMGRKGHFLTCAELCEVMYSVLDSRLGTYLSWTTDHDYRPGVYARSLPLLAKIRGLQSRSTEMSRWLANCHRDNPALKTKDCRTTQPKPAHQSPLSKLSCVAASALLGGAAGS